MKQRESFPSTRKPQPKRANPFDQSQKSTAGEKAIEEEPTFGREVDEATIKV